MKTTTSSRLKEIMYQKNLRQVDILKRAEPYCEKYGVKLKKNDLSQYVSGKVSPGQEKLTILALALCVSETWLMGYDVPMERISEKENSQQKETYSLHCKEILDVCQQLSVSNRSRVLSYSKKLLDTQQMEYELLAAHARTDVDVTEEDIQHDLDLMDDDGWE